MRQFRSPMSDNPFAALTAVVAPAILTNASSILALGTGNRVARVVDRTRLIAGELTRAAADSPEYAIYTRQLERLSERAQLLLRALRLFYASLGAFAATALIAVVGATLAESATATLFRATAIAGLASGGFAVGGLVFGCTLMVAETRLAVQNLTEEARLARRRAS